jgi:hypothetical protein
VLAVGVLALSSVLGCDGPRALPVTDAGVDVGPPPQVDLGPWEVDVGTLLPPEPCGYGVVCPDGRTCVDGSICSGAGAHTCSIGAMSEPPIWSHDSAPCARLSRQFPSQRVGHSLPLEFCAALNDPSSEASQRFAGIYDEGCYWPDGTPVEGPIVDTLCHGIPPGFVAEEWHVGWRFCGGTCGDGGCNGDPNEFEDGSLNFAQFLDRTRCVGLSSERSFGVCSADTRCSRSANSVGVCAGGFLGFYLGAEGRCVCMVTGEEPRTETPETQGWVVPHSVCLRYREIFPDTVACRDQAFELIP